MPPQRTLGEVTVSALFQQPFQQPPPEKKIKIKKSDDN